VQIHIDYILHVLFKKKTDNYVIINYINSVLAKYKDRESMQNIYHV